MLDYFVSENILGQVSIQLEMTSHDWSRLKASAAWMQVEQILMESEKQNSHCFRHNQTSKSEKQGEGEKRMKKTAVPKLMIAAVGKSTYVFLDGKCISDGLEDLKYSALDKDGKLGPILDMKINVSSFSFESGMTIEDFLEKSTEIKRMFQQSDREENELLEPKKET